MVEPEQRESIISSKRSLDSICDEFEAALKSGKRVRIESFTDRTRSATSKTRMLQALLEIELEHVLKERVPQEEEYLVRFPEEVACVKKAFEVFRERYPQRFAKTLSQGDGETYIGAPTPQFANVKLPLTFGRYVLQERLGAGGMGQVFRAYDNELRRDVALKLPLLDSDDPNQIERFRGEARTAATIEHPGVCQIYDIGELDGQQYITMKLVDGKSLSDLMREGKSFTIRQAVGLVRKIADALTVAHAKGVIHRDIKPANIMLTSKSEPIVVDFGLAHQSSESRSRLTQTGAAVGTPAYMPIEQATGDLKNINQRSDVYSLTAVLFRILAGEPPYQGTPLVIIGQIIAGRIPSLTEFRSDLDEELLRIVAKGMAYKQEDRYASMRELSNDLKEYLRRTADAGTATQTARPPAKPAPPAVPQPSTLANFGAGRRNWKRLLGAAFLFPFLFWLGTIIFVRTEHGTLRIEVLDPALQVTVDGEVVTVKDGDKSLELKTGPKRLFIKSDELGLEFEKEFTLSKDGEKRLHVVLVNGKDIDVLEGLAPRMAEAPLKPARMADHIEPNKSPEAAPTDILFADEFDKQDELLFDISPVPPVAREIRDGRYAFTTHSRWLTDLLPTKIGNTPVSGNFSCEVVGRAIGQDSARWGLYVTSTNLKEYQHFVHCSITNDGELEVVVSAALIDKQTPARQLHSHPAIKKGSGEFNNLVVIFRDENLVSVTINGQFVLHEYRLSKPIQNATIALEVRAKADHSVSEHPVRGEFERIVVRRPSPSPSESELLEIRKQAALTTSSPSPLAALDGIRSRFENASVATLEAIRTDLVKLRHQFPGTDEARTAGELLESESIRRLPPVFSISDTPAYEVATLKMDLQGEIPADIVGVFGDSRLKHWGLVSSVAFSPQGDRVASCSSDCTVRKWDTNTGKLQKVLHGHESGVKVVRWSPDGTRIASADHDGNIRLWDADSGELVHELTEHKVPVRALIFTEDSSQLISAGDEDRLIVWNTSEGTIAATLGNPDGVRTDGPNFEDAVLIPKTKTVVTVDHRGLMMFWDLQMQQRTKVIKASPQALRAIAVSADGSRLAIGGDEKVIAILDATTGDEVKRLKDKAMVVESLAFGSDTNTLIASGHAAPEGTRVWKIDSEEVAILSGHSNGSLSVVHSPARSMIATGSLDNTLRLWNVLTNQEWKFSDVHSSMISARIDSSRDVVGSGWDGSIIKRDQHGEIMWHRHVGRDIVNEIDVRSDGKIGYANTNSGRPGMMDKEGKNFMSLGPFATNAVQWSPDESKLLTGDYVAGAAYVWDGTTGERLAAFENLDIFARCVAWSPDGKLIAAGGGPKPGKRNVVFVWDVESKEQIAVMDCGVIWPRKLAFHPNGESLMVLNQDLREFRVSDGQLTRFRVISKFESFAMDISPSGQSIAVVSNDSKLRFLDHETLHEFHSVQIGPRISFINDLQYSDDGRYLITANANGTATVIAANESTRTTVPEAKSVILIKGATENAAVNSIQFTKDGRLITASSAGDIAAWDSAGIKINEVKLGREISDLTLTPTNDAIFVAGVGGLLQRVSLNKSDDRIEFKGYEPAVHVWDVALNTDGSRLVTCGSDGFVRIWNTETNKQERSWAVPGTARCEFLSSTGFVVTTGNHGEVSLWDADGRRQSIQNQQQRYLPGLVAGPNGQWIATVDYGNEAPGGWTRPTIVLRESNSLSPIQTIETACKSLAPGAVALSANGRYLAAAGRGVSYSGTWYHPGKSFAVYDLYHGQKLTRDLMRPSSFRSVAFSHDARSLAFGNGNGGVEVVALPSGPILPDGLDPVYERMVAQRVLKAGGRVHVMFPEKTDTLEIVSADQIPVCAMWIDRFYMPDSRSVPSGLFELLPSLYRLKDINVWGSAVNDSHLESIAKCHSLDGLLLNGTTVTDRGLAQLRGHHSLRRVVVQNRPITDAGLASIASIPTLKQLLVDGTSISDNGLLALTEIQRFEALEMNRTRLTDQIMSVVSKAENLQILRLSGTMVTATSLSKIAELKSLRGLTLDGTSVKPQDCHVLANLPSLRYLKLTKDDTTTAELEKLRAAMPWCEITVH